MTLDKKSITAGRHPIFAEGFGGMGQMQVEEGGGRGGQTRETREGSFGGLLLPVGSYIFGVIYYI